MSEETAAGFHLNLWTRLSASWPGWMWPRNQAIWICPGTDSILFGEKWLDCSP